MDPHVEVEQVRRYLVDGWQSFAYMPGDSWGTKTQTLRDCRVDGKRKGGGHGGSSPEQWQSLPTRILAASPHLQGYDVPGDELDRLKAEGLTLVEALEELGIA